jgi:hypothetical protein
LGDWSAGFAATIESILNHICSYFPLIEFVFPPAYMVGAACGHSVAKTTV